MDPAAVRRIASHVYRWYGLIPRLKTDKDLTPNQCKIYLNALSAFERRQYGMPISSLGPLVAEEPEFFAGRKLLREAEILGSSGASSFRGLSGSGISLGRGKVRKLIESGDFQAALAEAEKALESDPTGVTPNKSLHDAAEAAAAEARKELGPLEAALKAAPAEESKAAARLCDAVRERVRTYEAIAAFALETIIRRDEKNNAPRHELGDYWLRLEDYDKATEVFRIILEKDPKDLLATSKLKEAAARRSLKGMDAPKESERSPTPRSETLEEIEKEVNDAGANPDLVKARKLADLYYKDKRFQEALEWYNYLSGCTGHTDALLLDLVRKCRDRNFEAETAELRNTLDGLQPGDNSAEAIKAKIGRLEREQADRSLADARQRVERNPTDLKHRLDLGRCLKEAQRYEEAIPELQRASGHPGAHIDSMVLLAKCFSELKMFDLAIDILNETEEQIPEMNEAKKETLYNLGIVYGLSGSNDQSLECMKRIYKRDCSYRDVAQRVEESYKV